MCGCQPETDESLKWEEFREFVDWCRKNPEAIRAILANKADVFVVEERGARIDVSPEAVRLWKNTNAFIRNVDMQYESKI